MLLIPLDACPAVGSGQGVQVVDVATGLEESARVCGAQREDSGVDEVFATAPNLDLKVGRYEAAEHLTQRSTHRRVTKAYYYSRYCHKSSVLDFEHEATFSVFE